MSAMKTRRINAKQTLLVLAALLWAFTGCQQKEDDPQPIKSVVGTSDPTDVSLTSVTLNGIISTVGSGGITDHGFVWSETQNPDLSSAGKQSLGATNEATTFTTQITGLNTGTLYYVRAYVTDAQGTFYGGEKNFSTGFAPSITGFTPTEGGQGDTLTINGGNYTTTVADITVKIGGVAASSIVSASRTEIKVVIPSGVTEGTNKITVGIAEVEITSNSDFTYLGGLWTQRKDFPSTSRWNAVGLVTGDKGYFGLGLGQSASLNDFWQYDPTTDTWTQKADYQGEGRTSSVVWVNQGSVYVGLGRDEANTGKKDFWQYAPGSNSWSKFTDYTGTVNGNEVAFVLGFDGYVISNTTKEVWQFSAATWTQKNNTPFTGTKNHFVLNDVAYVLATDNKLWKYNATNDSWSEVKSFPGNALPNFSFTVGNKGYAAEVLGFTIMWEYDPSNDSWTKKNSLKQSESPYTNAGVMVLNNKAYIQTGGAVNNELWEFDPSK